MARFPDERWQMVLRQLVYNWLRGQAGQKLAAAATRAAADDGQQSSSSDPPHRVENSSHFGIVVTENAEAGSILDQLGGTIKTAAHGFNIYEGHLRGRRVVVAQAGSGPAAAALATRALLAGHRPEWVIAAGFAAALVPALQRGDLIVANRVVDESERGLKIDIQSRDGQEPAEFQLGCVVTASQKPATELARQKLAASSRADVVDSSSMEVAQVCREAHVRCLVVRVVLELFDDQLPKEKKFVGSQKSLAGRLGAAAGALIRRPASARDWWHLKQESLQCADRLALFLVTMMLQLVPRSSLKPAHDPPVDGTADARS
jgi:adenosylhomocysteine nucleosidase